MFDTTVLSSPARSRSQEYPHRPTTKPGGFRRRRITQLVTVAVAALTIGAAGAPAPAAAATAPSELSAGQVLAAGQALVSPNGTYSLRMQTDGNLVEYGPSGWMWQSNTNGSGSANRLVMQGDGNLVMYTSSGGVPFTTGSAGSGNRGRLVVQDDGNVVQYGNAGAVFATKTNTERAIQWFYDKRGSTAYEGMCEKAVENAFGTTGRYSTAYANWQARPQKNAGSMAPRGTLVFWRTSTAGHVGISLGNGTVMSSSAAGRKIGISPITGWFNPLLGWAPSPW